MKLPPPKLVIGYICGITASLFWGFHSVLIRYLATTGVNPTGIATVRLFMGATGLFIAFAIISLFQRKKIFTPSFSFHRYFWFAVVGLAANFFLFHKGLTYTIASDAILLEAFSPVVVFMLTILFLPQRIKHLRHTPHLLSRILFLVVAGSIGAALIIINEPPANIITVQSKFIGDIIEFGAMFFFALFMLSSHEVQSRDPEQHPLRVSAFMLFFTALLLTPFVPWGEMLALTSTQWLWLLVLGFGSTFLNYALWQVATLHLDATPLALLFSLSSVWNVAVESYIFHLPLSPKLIIGAVFILIASIVTQTISSRHQVTSPGEVGEL